MPTTRYPMHDHGLFVMAMQAQTALQDRGLLVDQEKEN